MICRSCRDRYGCFDLSWILQETQDQEGFLFPGRVNTKKHNRRVQSVKIQLQFHLLCKYSVGPGSKLSQNINSLEFTS